MNQLKPVRKIKDSPSNLAKNYLRYSHQLIKQKAGGVIGPRFVFISLRVPQIKLVQ